MSRKMSEIEEELSGWRDQLLDQGINCQPVDDALVAARSLINDLELEVRSLNHVLAMFSHDGEQFKLGVSAGRTQLKLWMERAAAEYVGLIQHIDKQFTTRLEITAAHHHLVRTKTEYQALAHFLALSAAKIDDWQPIPPTETEQKLEKAMDLFRRVLEWNATSLVKPDVLTREMKDFLEGK